MIFDDKQKRRFNKNHWSNLKNIVTELVASLPSYPSVRFQYGQNL